MLASEANLVASVNAQWSEQTRAALVEILDRVAAEEHARTTREVRAIFAFARSAQAAQEAVGEAMSLEPIMPPREGVVVYECEAGDVWTLVQTLKSGGAATFRCADAIMFSARAIR